MKMINRLIVVMALCTFATVSAEPETNDTKPNSERMQRRAKRGNRQLSPELLKKYDKDGDGKLSEEERAAMREDFKAMRKELLKKYDADGDGKLSKEELDAARKAGAEIPPFLSRGKNFRNRGERGVRGGKGEGWKSKKNKGDSEQN